MFALAAPTKSKLIEHRTLSKKNRPPDEKPGVKLTIEQQWPNAFLDFFDPRLRQMLYEKAKGTKAAQTQLEGMESTDLPSLTDAGVKLANLRWHHDMTGYSVDIRRGAGLSGSNAVSLSDAVLSGWKITLKDGGTVVSRYYIEAGNIPGHAWELFAELKSREFEMTATPPALDAQRDIEGEDENDDDAPKPAATRKPGPAERAAVDKIKGGRKPAVAHKPSKAAARAAAEAAFQQDKPKPVVTTKSPAGSRTARGAAATKAALEAGAKAAAASGVSSDGAWPFPKRDNDVGAQQSSETEHSAVDAKTEDATS